ncbi:MAG: flagellar type III secretion system protein FlhB [Sulfitobacter sp.]
MSDEDSGEKTFDATPQKLLEARKKGEIAKSADLLTAAGYGGLLIALLAVGTGAITQMGSALMVLIDRAGELAPLFFGGTAQPPTLGLIRQINGAILPFFAMPALAVILCALAQRAIVFAPSKIAPKLNRISILANAKNKFGRSGLFEFTKSFTKLCIYSTCLALFIRANLPEMIAVLGNSPRAAVSLLAQLCLSFLFAVVLISGAIGVIDAIWQHHEHLRKNRMSRKDIMDETKQAEGDPHLKQERRQRAMSISQSRMMQDVPQADVIIVNPTHYAVALKWSRLPGEAPVCVAKGLDEIAARIREIANESAVPIHSDPPTARALHATTKIGDQIAPEHFRAVAAAIRFAETMRLRARGR